MKNYYQFEIGLSLNGTPIGGENFGAKAAIEHRIAKASHAGAKPFLNAKTGKNATSKYLGAGTFKKVFETPAAANAPIPINDKVKFVLAKLDCFDKEGRGKDKAWENAQDAVADQVKTMILYGQPQTSLYVTFDQQKVILNYGTGAYVPPWVCPRLYLYLPRVSGHDLVDLIKGTKGSLNRNDSILYFVSLCHELKALHEAGYFHADLKPANIMADPASGAALIDFGGVKRSWHSYGVHTPSYCINDRSYIDRFTRCYRNILGGDPSATILTGLRNCRTVFNDLRSALAQRKRNGAGYESCAIRSTVAPVRMGPTSGARPFIFGAAYDTAALAMIALELKLWDVTTEPLFEDLIKNYFKPSFLEPIIAHLSSVYTGAVNLASPQKLRIYTSAIVDGVNVTQSVRAGIEPAAVTEVIKDRYVEKLETQKAAGTLTADQLAASMDLLPTIDKSFKVFRKFSAIRAVYKQSEIAARQNVETKFLTLTHLINTLTYITDGIALQKTLTQIFAVSLVNRSVFAAATPTSFGLLLGAAKDPEILPIIQANFNPQFSADTSVETFKEWVKEAISNLIPIAESRTAFRKGDRYQTIMKILQEVSAPPVNPVTKEQARAFAANKSEAVKTEFLNNRDYPLISTYISAANAERGSAPEWISEKATIATYIQQAFNDMRAGLNNDTQWAEYQHDIQDFYSV